MIRNCFFQLIKFQRITPKFYRYSQFNKKNSTSQSQLILKDQDFDKVVEYWDQQVSKPKPNSVSIEKVLNKISLAEHLLGSELQDKNWEFFEDMFDKNFLERLYIPSQYPQKIQIILNLSMELSLLEYQYRLNRKEFPQLEQVLERIRGILENIYNFESKISDLGEAEFNNLLRQSQLFDMKAFYQKTLNPDGYLEFLEESTKCLDQAVKIVNDIIKHKENVEQIKYQIGKTQAMSKIARNFEMLAEFLLISGQEEEALPFLEKALEIYNTFTDGITPKHVLCRCRIARAHVKDNYELALEKIDELFEDIKQYGETDILFVIKMYRFVILSQKEIVETQYEDVFEMMKKYRVTDPFIMSEVLYYSIKYTYKQGYSKALNEHLHQALVLLETSVGKINLEQLLHLVAEVSVDLPKDIKDQNQILKIVYENFEKLKQQIDDSYFSDHLFYQSLIKAKLLFNDKKQPEIIVQPFISFIEQIKDKGQTNINHYLKLITKFLEKNGITVTQKQLEDLSQKIQIK